MKNISENVKGLMNIKSVMEHFSISRNTLYRWTTKENLLPYVKIGGRKLFKIEDLNELIEKNYTTP